MINKQDFLNAWTQEIEMVRGDTLAFNFQLAGLGSKKAYTDLEVNFVVSEHYEEDPIMSINTISGITLEDYNEIKDLATFSVCVAPNYTKNLMLTRYYYDMKIKDGYNVLTLMRGHLTLLYDIAD